MTHTPGPWKINKYGSVGGGDFGTEPIIAQIEPFYGEDLKFGDHSENAQLIAASPTLEEALDRLIQTAELLSREVLDPGSEALTAIYCARQALAKARRP